MQEYDKSSKWLIEHHGDSILRLGGVRGIEWWRSLQAELVQSRRLPDGLIEAKLPGKAEPVRFLVEISTYPYRRLSKQVVEGTVLSYLDREQLPEVLTLVLHPGWRKRVADAAELVSPLGWTRLHLEWKVVELWTILAADLLAADDIGLIPWVTLAKIDGPPEPIFRECRARIDREASGGDRQNLLGVTQFLARLNDNDPRLFQIFGGRKAMIDSPVLRELLAERDRHVILTVLGARFGQDADAVQAGLNRIKGEKRLTELAKQAATCPDLEAFRKMLEPAPRGRK
jgi:hypothetical protein